MLEYLLAYLIVGFRVLALVAVNVVWFSLLVWLAGNCCGDIGIQELFGRTDISS